MVTGLEQRVIMMLKAGIYEGAIIQRLRVADRLNGQEAEKMLQRAKDYLENGGSTTFEEGQQENTYSPPAPEFNKYFKMSSMGVNSGAVKQRMLRDGVSQEKAEEYIQQINISLNDDSPATTQQEDAHEDKENDAQHESAVAGTKPENMEPHIIIPDRVAVITNGVSKEKCSQLVKAAEKEGLRKNENLFSLDQRFRYEFYDTELSNQISDLVSQVTPRALPRGRTYSGVKDKLRIYKYEEGEDFKPHVDGGFRVLSGPRVGDTSVYTFVLYLTDETTGLQGGGTRFCDVPNWPENVPTTIAPSIGNVLVFRQKNTKHEGCKVSQGVKYIIQGHVMYSKPAADPTKPQIQTGSLFGQSGSSFPNVFELVECSFDHVDPAKNLYFKKNPIEFALSVVKKNNKKQLTKVEKIAQMLRAELTEENCRHKCIWAGLKQDEIDSLIAQAKEYNIEREKNPPIATIAAANKKSHEKSSFDKSSRSYRMLKAGVNPQAVAQLLATVDRVPIESARAQVEYYTSVLSNQGALPQYNY